MTWTDPSDQMHPLDLWWQLDVPASPLAPAAEDFRVYDYMEGHTIRVEPAAAVRAHPPILSARYRLDDGAAVTANSLLGAGEDITLPVTDRFYGLQVGLSNYLGWSEWSGYFSVRASDRVRHTDFRTQDLGDLNALPGYLPLSSFPGSSNMGHSSVYGLGAQANRGGTQMFTALDPARFNFGTHYASETVWAPVDYPGGQFGSAFVFRDGNTANHRALVLIYDSGSWKLLGRRASTVAEELLSGTMDTVPTRIKLILRGDGRFTGVIDGAVLFDGFEGSNYMGRAYGPGFCSRYENGNTRPACLEFHAGREA